MSWPSFADIERNPSLAKGKADKPPRRRSSRDPEAPAIKLAIRDIDKRTKVVLAKYRPEFKRLRCEGHYESAQKLMLTMGYELDRLAWDKQKLIELLPPYRTYEDGCYYLHRALPHKP